VPLPVLYLSRYPVAAAEVCEEGFYKFLTFNLSRSFKSCKNNFRTTAYDFSLWCVGKISSQNSSLICEGYIPRSPGWLKLCVIQYKVCLLYMHTYEHV
jgi:hypothetical protein